MSANTETTEADRTGCKAWCGLPGVKAITSCVADDWFMHDADVGRVDTPRFCTPACRDARLPPIAAPVAHIERRKGQRWEFDFDGRSPGQAYTLTSKKSDCWWATDKSGRESCFASEREFAELPHMFRLLADAPPETPKPCTCPHGPSTTDGKCPIHVTAGITVSGFQGCACAKCVPPAQEAPKAWAQGSNDGKTWVYCTADYGRCAHRHHRATHEAPKAEPLPFSFTDDEGRVHRFATGNERDAASRAYWSWMAEQTGKPYAGPERLPRPQLAADWVEDFLPESGR